MRKYNKKHLAFLLPIGILEIVMLILECLPYGVEIHFDVPAYIGATGHYSEFYPYFSGIPYNYANFYPIYIGILTIAVIILWFVNLFVDKRGVDIAIFVMTILKFIFGAVELIYSQTAINWAMFALSFVLAIYCIAKAIVNKEFAKKKPTLDADEEKQELEE